MSEEKKRCVIARIPYIGYRLCDIVHETEVSYTILYEGKMAHIKQTDVLAENATPEIWKRFQELNMRQIEEVADACGRHRKMLDALRHRHALELMALLDGKLPDEDA